MTQKALVNGATLAFDVRGSGPPLVSSWTIVSIRPLGLRNF
jgi:hypothetical protein